MQWGFRRDEQTRAALNKKPRTLSLVALKPPCVLSTPPSFFSTRDLLAKKTNFGGISAGDSTLSVKKGKGNRSAIDCGERFDHFAHLQCSVAKMMGLPRSLGGEGKRAPVRRLGERPYPRWVRRCTCTEYLYVGAVHVTVIPPTADTVE